MPTRLALATLSGIAFALSFPNAAIGWLSFLALAPLLVAVVRANGAREAFLLGWLSQSVAWLIMVPWVVRVMSHYGGLPFAAGAAIFVAMAAYLGLFGALFGFLVYRIRPGAKFLRWLLIPMAWAATEFARTYLFTGFPWNLIATAIIDYTSLIQIDRFAGPYFVGFLIVVPSAALAWWITQKARGIERFFVTASVVVVFFVWWATGLVGSKLIARPSAAPRVKAALLQPNISQQMRWDEANLIAIFRKMIAMTETAANNGANVVVWPESTVPLSYSSTDFYRDAIESLSAHHKIDIILGSVAEDAQNRNRIWNAAFLVSDGKTVGHYDKIRLVPFGEYVPLRKLLFFAEKLVREVGEFAFGENDQPLRGKLAYGPAICYEVVFPQITRTQVRNGANVLVTITNDAWYDGTSAPAQHLNQARLRAIEDDRWLLRAATTGISALVDPTGRIVERIPMGRDGIIYAAVQPRTSTTPYVRFGDWFAWISVAAVAVGMMRRNKP